MLQKWARLRIRSTTSWAVSLDGRKLSGALQNVALDGSVITWGRLQGGEDASTVQGHLTNVEKVKCNGTRSQLAWYMALW